MPAHRPSGASRRACLLAVAVLVAAVPAARAAAPDKDSSEKRPYVVVLKNRSANAKAVGADHGRRFGVAVKMLYDRGLRGYAGLMTDEDAKRVAREPGVVIAPDTEVSGFEVAGSPQQTATTSYGSPALSTGSTSMRVRSRRRTCTTTAPPAPASPPT